MMDGWLTNGRTDR